MQQLLQTTRSARPPFASAPSHFHSGKLFAAAFETPAAPADGSTVARQAESCFSASAQAGSDSAPPSAGMPEHFERAAVSAAPPQGEGIVDAYVCEEVEDPVALDLLSDVEVMPAELPSAELPVAVLLSDSLEQDKMGGAKWILIFSVSVN